MLARYPAPMSDAYDDLGLLAMGGMGEVRRVRDPRLGRVVAMKVIRPEMAAHPALLARFVEEAQATAQLEHPGIVPVHAIGSFPDGRAWFTMREIHGVTLAAAIFEHHAGAGSMWTFRRLVDALLRVCEAVAYAHARGVLHRDLKPANVMLGEFGEVLVLDWGLAKVRGGEVTTERHEKSPHATRVGLVAGTPAYMPPEQARGELANLGPSADVYALGAILYEILAGRPPYAGNDSLDVLRAVLFGPPAPVGQPADWHSTDVRALPAELVVACNRAMARKVEDRFPDARALADEIRAWLDGARKREQALELVAEAEEILIISGHHRTRAEGLRAEARVLLDDIPPYAPEAQKHPGWSREDQAAAVHEEAELREVDASQRLHSALSVDPTCVEAHALLGDVYRRRHAEAEERRDPIASRYEARLRVHDRGAHVRYLSGVGAVTLVTTTPATVDLYRYEPQHRRLIPVFVRTLGRTPLSAVELPRGSYLLVAREPGFVEVRYPVHIGREEHWDGVRPGDSMPLPIRLPRHDELAADDCYVPAGWFRSGGDSLTPGALPPRRLWCDGFVIRRFPVTNRDFMGFLDALVDTGREADALRICPQERHGTNDAGGLLVYNRDPSGHFHIGTDGDGDRWNAEWPVFLIDWWGAAAYARWQRDKEGIPWRLPCELEWEKAARGADGRTYPWGEYLDPTWACMRDSVEGRRLPAEIQHFPADESPCGAREMAGNVQDWCLDLHRREGPTVIDGIVKVEVPADSDPAPRVIRGGGWNSSPAFLRTAFRYANLPVTRDSMIGLRILRPWG